ncbi:hypothetical protein BDN70DRAFT_869985 [Pholiota conissans]|uniref:Nucleoporin Pom152 n=1 Tax=Pholiota conissans TaxID=109636 RepID=A0A9P6D896_9AGAR|nr:hypothetical protein BDN70DRAFT_869985 [Pholiota conissans]
MATASKPPQPQPPTANGSTKISTPNPLIPEKYVDVPSQRLYYLSFGLLCQSIKILDFVWSLASGGNHTATYRKWLMVDFLYCVVLSQLRIPRLQYGKASILLQIGTLWFLDSVMFGGINVNASALLGGSLLTPGFSDVPSVAGTLSIRDFLAYLTFGLIASSSKDSHLLGQHTVRMSPISTAHLNPQNLNFCLSSPNNQVFIPVVLNNTDIAGLKYSITPLGYLDDNSNGKIEVIDLNVKDLKSISQTQIPLLTQPTATPRPGDEDYDEYDDDDEVEVDTASKLQITQSMSYIPLSRPGIIRLERVYDQANANARLVISEAVVVPCPQVEFAKDEGPGLEQYRCAGQELDTQLKINVYGVPPLSLRWIRTINEYQEQFLVEGIQGDHKDVHDHQEEVHTTEIMDKTSLTTSSLISRVPSPQRVLVPLSISLKKPGAYLYALEEITDGVGNTVRVGFDLPPPDIDSFTGTKTTRSFMVLEKPSVAFSHCSTDLPDSLLIGSETTIAINPMHVSSFDAPLALTLAFRPTVDDIKEKRSKPHNTTLKISASDKVSYYRAKEPGEYQIIGIKGKYCTGTVLSPDTCRVIQKPLPSADIEWKRIHECSGDTGVSASLVFHGTPPFTIYYKTQRDNEPAITNSQTYTSYRAELVLQPERSGHHVFTFTALSDQNYRKIELQGPSIDQMIHPLASADFAGSGRGRKIVSSCSGDAVDIAVDLKGTAPWNIELQIIGPKTAEVMSINDIERPRATISVPIPKELQQNGGSFEIDLVSVADASKCKRPISVLGIVVKVKRTVPTAQFYGKPEERKVIVAENERASLPLRLSGDMPWTVKYKRHEARTIMEETFYDRNAEIQVIDQGLYEILEVYDKQCPGIVVSDGATYKVEWIPRPSARLSSETKALHAHNGSYILPPICEGLNDHVDLDLTGRPPFQIMYNIAQNTGAGGNKLMDQPIFNSIQPRTRFQLQTSIAGRVYYEVQQIGDAAYPLSGSKDKPIPRTQRLLFEQQVSLRPSARFYTRNRLGYCLHDALVPLDSTPSDGVVQLAGVPPFTIMIAIKNIAASHVETRTIVVPTNTWRLDIPTYTFNAVGAHLLSIEKVTDASGCEQAALDPMLRTIWIDVAETASIVPFERREDICVGDRTQFQLEGIPPWTIGYKVNGKSYTQEARTSPFSILQQQPGLFTVTTIAHQQKMCKAAVADLRFNVHELPSAQVGHGKRIYQDIHEGDQAEIVFTLIGEPPFTFTYQRSELSSKKDVIGKVLETHTVSRVQAKEYSIFSALEGTWTVTSISDKYCRYPPVNPDAAEKRK